MDCGYFKNDEFISAESIIEKFFKETNSLKNSAIYSSEEIQASTVREIRRIEGANAFGNDADTNEHGFSPVVKFIVTDNSALFAKKGLPIPSSGRVVPEYIEEERCYQYVAKNLSKVEDLSDTIDVSNLPIPRNLEFVLQKLEKNNIVLSKNKVIILLNEIEDAITVEEKTKNLGTLLHNLISLKIRNEDTQYNTALNGFISDAENRELLGEDKDEEWEVTINSIVNNLIKTVERNGELITEIFIPSLVNDVKVRGKLDLIAVDTSGNAHIFEIKISKHSYDKWDSAKLRTLDWQLAVYRQLLGQHVRVDNTRLYTIPIQFSTFGNPNSLKLGNIEDRTAQNVSELGKAGGIKYRASKLIPEKIIPEYNKDREVELKKDLNTLIPNYKIRTGEEDLDLETIVEEARAKLSSGANSVWRTFSKFKEVPDLTLKRGYIEANTEEEFRAQIKTYLIYAEEQINNNVSELANAIVSALKNKTAIKMGYKSSDQDLTINNLLKEYLNDDWEVVENLKEAIALGLIVIRNKNTGDVNVVSLTANDLMAGYDEDYSILYGDLEIYKAFLFVNNLKDELFPGGAGRLGKIIVYNPVNQDPYHKSSISKYKEFRDRMNKKGLGDKLILKEDNVLGIVDIAHLTLNSYLTNFEGSEKEVKTIRDIFHLEGDDIGIDIESKNLEELLEIQKEFYQQFPELKNKSLEKGFDLGNKNEMLLALLQVAIVSRNQGDITGDFRGLTKFSLNFSDFKSLFAAIYTDKQSTYDREGRRIQGVVRGMVFSPPDWISSQDMRSINKLLSASNQVIRKKFFRAHEKIYSVTNAYYKEINYSSASREWVGESQSKHSNLFIHKNDKVSEEFATKNPYVDNNENALSDPERKYLKTMLLYINQYKLNLTDAEIDAINPDKLESLLKNDVIKAAYEDGSYFEVPLVRREESTKYKGMLEDSGKLWARRIKEFGSEVNDFLDTKELDPENLELIKKQKMGYYEMYDAYGKQTKAYKSKVINKFGVDYFEFNLDTIAHRIAFNKIRKNVYDQKLPIINAYIWWMKMLAGKENVDISNQLEYIANQLNLSAYDDNIIDPEFKDVSIITSGLKKFATFGMLALKPLSLVKEMTIGTFKGMTLAATKIYGKEQFGVKDVMFAYEKLTRIDNKFSMEFNLIDKLNQYYGFANMDVNTIASKMQSDRRGVYRGLGRWLYMANTSADYYNRLVILIAKMNHDGSYEAHSLDENGNFSYDPSKDKRFSHYFANREKHKLGDFYAAAKSDEVFNKQRRHYLLHQSLLNKENVDAKYTEKDLVKDAYSETERSSLKSFSDMAYGYYDKDAQAQVTSTWYGIAWLQFMQFWPGKMTMWFAKPDKESPLGKVVQDFVEKEDGTKVLLWKKTTVDEDGTIHEEPTEENTGDPIYKWVGTAYEGLAYAMLGTARDLATLNFTSLKNNEERSRRALFGVADGILMFLMLGIAGAILDAFIAENGSDGISGRTLSMMNRVNGKMMNEFNLYKSTIGAINSEPAFLSWGQKLGNDALGVFEGDKELSELMLRNFGAAEIFKE